MADNLPLLPKSLPAPTSLSAAEAEAEASAAASRAAPNFTQEVLSGMQQAEHDRLTARKEDDAAQQRLQGRARGQHAKAPPASDVPAGTRPLGLSLQEEVDLLPVQGGQGVLISQDSLGNGMRLTLELGGSLMGAQNAAAATAGADASVSDLGVWAALTAVSLQAAENIAGAFATESPSQGQAVQLYAQAEVSGQTVEARQVVVDDLSLAQAGYDGSGASWPYALRLGLEQLLAAQLGGLAGALGEVDKVRLALAALIGRPTLQLGPSHGAQALFAAMSQANPPLGVPVLVSLATGSGGKNLAWYVVLGTELTSAGSEQVRLLSLTDWLAGGLGSESAGLAGALEMSLAALLARLSAVVLPDGRPCAQPTARHAQATSGLGLGGCCLMQSGGTKGVAPQAAGAVAGQRGTVSARCLTCPVAQQRCLPTAG